MLKVNKLIMSPGSAVLGSGTTVTSTGGATMPDDLDPLKMLQGIEELYITLKQQNNYPPGEQPVADKKLSAMQGKVKKLKKQLAELTQDRSASSTSGGGGGSSKGPIKNKKGELVECYKCKGNHYKKDCPELAASDTDATSVLKKSFSTVEGQTGRELRSVLQPLTAKNKPLKPVQSAVPARSLFSNNYQYNKQ
jgi:hypothetical protein